MSGSVLVILDPVTRKRVHGHIQSVRDRVWNRLVGRWVDHERPISRAERKQRARDYAEEQAMYEAALSTNFPAATRKRASLKRAKDH